MGIYAGCLKRNDNYNNLGVHYSSPDNKGYPHCNSYLAGKDKYKVLEIECYKFKN